MSDNIKEYYEQKKCKLEFFTRTVLSPKPNIHPELELILVLDGSIDAYINNRKFTAKKNEAVLVFPNQLHYYEQNEDSKYMLIIFYNEVVPYAKKTLLYSSPVSNIVNYENMQNVNFAISQLRPYTNYSRGFENGDQNFPLLLSGYLNIILHDIIPQMKFNDISEIDNKMAHRLLQYCTQHFEENISLQSVCDACGFSYYQISRLFYKTFGLNFSAYINNLRVSKACILLKESQMNINDIAYSVGFDTIRNFNRVFFSIMQMTPSEYKGK